MTDYVESPIDKLVAVGWGAGDPGVLLFRGEARRQWDRNTLAGAQSVILQFPIATWDALPSPPVLTDRVRALAGATVLDDHPIIDIQRSEFLGLTQVTAATAFGGPWSVPSTKPLRFETRRNATDALITFSVMGADLYTYTYTFNEFIPEGINEETHVFTVI